MAWMLLKRFPQPQICNFAEAIIKAQTAEIQQMQLFSFNTVNL
ncbi:hypothetical protein [Atlanticothrix silvestris]